MLILTLKNSNLQNIIYVGTYGYKIYLYPIFEKQIFALRLKALAIPMFKAHFV